MIAIDKPAVLVGALSGIVLLIPATILNVWLVDEDGGEPSGWVLAVFFLFFVAFFVAGLVAGDRQPNTPLIHGGLAAGLAYLVVQGVFLVKRLVMGDSVDSWLGIVFLLLLSTSCGLAGGLGASWLHGKRAAAAARDDEAS